MKTSKVIEIIEKAGYVDGENNALCVWERADHSTGIIDECDKDFANREYIKDILVKAGAKVTYDIIYEQKGLIVF